MIDAELDLCPAYGWQCAPEFETLIKRLRSGRERRRPLRDYVLHRFSLPFQNIHHASYLLELKSVFLAAMGSAESFKVKDESDFEAENVIFGTGDGTETDFDLTKPYSFGSTTYLRRIYFPVGDTYTVNGVPATAAYNSTTNKVQFAVAPAAAAVLRWSGEFRTLVRFVSDTLPMSIDSRSSGEYVMNGSIELMEVLE